MQRAGFAGGFLIVFFLWREDAQLSFFSSSECMCVWVGFWTTRVTVTRCMRCTARAVATVVCGVRIAQDLMFRHVRHLLYSTCVVIHAGVLVYVQ